MLQFEKRVDERMTKVKLGWRDFTINRPCQLHSISNIIVEVRVEVRDNRRRKYRGSTRKYAEVRGSARKYRGSTRLLSV